MKYRLSIKNVFSGANKHSSRPVLVAELLYAAPVKPVGAVLVDSYCRDLLQRQPPHVNEWVHELPPLSTLSGQQDVGSLIAYTALVLQRWVGYPVSHMGVGAVQRLNPRSGKQRIILELCVAKPAVAALNCAASVVSEYLQTKGASLVNTQAQNLQQYVENYVDKPAAIVKFIREASARRIPWNVLAQTDLFMDVGQGIKKRRILLHFTSRTSHIASLMSTDKQLTNKLFDFHGLPVPVQRVVRHADDACTALTQLGAPVVVKPVSQDFGLAVYPGLSREAEVRTAFARAITYGPVLVEKHIPGDHHRLMVINDHFISARRQLPAHVIGDGTNNINALVETANKLRLANGWKPIPLDAESEIVLSQQGITVETVPSAGQRVNLRLQGNLSTGGTMEIVTDQVHPDNIRMALRAARIMEIDVAGIDFITPDISRSFMDVGGAICEINVTPGFIFNEEKLLFDHWFPDRDDGRIPVIGLLDPDDHLLACATKMLSQSVPGVVALAAGDGLFIDGNKVFCGPDDQARTSRMAVNEPTASGAVINFSTLPLLRQGAGVDRLSVLLVQNKRQNNRVTEADRRRAFALLAKISDHVLFLGDERHSLKDGKNHSNLLDVVPSGIASDDSCPFCGRKTAIDDIALLSALGSHLNTVMHIQ